MPKGHKPKSSGDWVFLLLSWGFGVLFGGVFLLTGLIFLLVSTNLVDKEHQTLVGITVTVLFSGKLAASRILTHQGVFAQGTVVAVENEGVGQNVIYAESCREAFRSLIG